MQILISSVAYAGSHITQEGFVELLVLGTVLGTVHIVSKNDLWVPTMTHSLYNLCIFIAILLAGTVE
jgi:membrane protease YdiL (CAAX protease family)